ncbi:TOMM precursor leader peptide-binding protein [Streptomyces sp. NPDC006700]|uniref:TOMM precursor leader peptide-binding protein n=1 Tax=unclassified Streptomyces TaxID=2593676 RepID=UPI00340DBD58
MAELTETRIFLRQDSVFLAANGGVFMRSAKGNFYIKGDTAYGWTSALAPQLAKGTTQRELCAGLDPQRARIVSGLVHNLMDSGLVAPLDPEPEGLLTPAELTLFAPQIAFLAHHTTAPHHAMRRVRDVRVAVAGEGEEAATAARTLLRNGVGHVALLGSAAGDPRVVEELRAVCRESAQRGAEADVTLLAAAWDHGWTAGLADWKPSAVLAPPHGVPDRTRDELARTARAAGAAFVSARTYGDLLVKGPLESGSKPCRNCLELQLADHAADSLVADLHRRRVAALARPGAARVSPVVAMTAASELATEVFQHLSGARVPDLLGAVLVQHPLTLETWRETLVARPDCAVCASAPSLAERQTRLKAVRKGDHDLPEATVGRTTPEATRRAPPWRCWRAWNATRDSSRAPAGPSSAPPWTP